MNTKSVFSNVIKLQASENTIEHVHKWETLKHHLWLFLFDFYFPLLDISNEALFLLSGKYH